MSEESFRPEKISPRESQERSLPGEKAPLPEVLLNENSLKAESDRKHLNTIRKKLGLPIKGMLFGAFATTLAPHGSSAEEIFDSAAETTHTFEQSTPYYEQGLEELRQLAHGADQEAKRLYQVLPDGREVWISMETPDKDVRYENDMGGVQISHFNEEKMDAAIRNLQSGGHAEFIHTHQTKLLEQYDSMESGRAGPPSRTDIFSMISVYGTALEKGVEDPFESIGFEAVTENGVWKYSMEKEDYEFLSNALKTTEPYLKQVEQISKRDHGQGLRKVILSVFGGLTEADPASRELISSVRHSNTEVLLNILRDPLILRLVAQNHVNATAHEVSAQERSIAALCIEAKNALSTQLDERYYKEESAKTLVKDAGYDALSSVAVSTDGSYEKNWGRLGVNLTFTPLEQSKGK